MLTGLSRDTVLSVMVTQASGSGNDVGGECEIYMNVALASLRYLNRKESCFLNASVWSATRSAHVTKRTGICSWETRGKFGRNIVSYAKTKHANLICASMLHSLVVVPCTVALKLINRSPQSKAMSYVDEVCALQ